MRLWEKLTADNVVGEFEREEVKSSSAETPNSERTFDIKTLFADPPQQVRCSVNADEKEQEEVEKENRWLQ